MDKKHEKQKPKVLITASVASMIDQFNMYNIHLLLEMGYEVHVACNFKKGNTCDRKRLQKLSSTLESLHVVQHQWDCPRGVGSIAASITAYWQLRKLIDKYLFAWIHCHSPMGSALTRVAAHRKNVRVVYTAHGFHFYKGAPLKNWLLYYPVEKLLARWTYALITMNEEDSYLARHNLKTAKVFCIPGVGVDMRRFGQEASEMEKSRFRREHDISPDAYILLSVGELSSRKNHSAVLHTLPKLAEKNVYYIICGQGSLKKTLLREAEKLGVGNRVRMTGYLEQVEVFYRNADIFVFPSVQEGLPVALMEAMAASLPCVVSDIRGNKELIDQKFRFSLGRPDQLVFILNQLLKDPAAGKKQGQRNWQKVKNYSSTVVEQRMRDVYKYMRSGKEKETNAADFRCNGHI